MKLRTKTPIIICAIPLLLSVAPAATILTGPGDFIGPTTLVNFETFPGGGIVPINASSPGILSNQWSSLGILISDGSPTDGAGAYFGTFSVPPHSGTLAIGDSTGSLSIPGQSLYFDFIDPANGLPTGIAEAGLWIQNGDPSPASVSFFAIGGTLLQTISVGTGDTFVGLRAIEGVSRISIIDSGYFLADDLQFTPVPEPSTLCLLAAFGFAVRIGLWSRKKQERPA